MNEQLMRMEKRETEKKESIVEEKVEKIDLSGMSLSSLPNQPHLTMISTLDLSNNNIKIIPESVAARLLNVEVLDLHSNQLKSLPNSISCISKLKFLNVSGNLLSSLPKTIENCRSLEELNANFNQLTRLPDTIGFELENLKKLSVNSNKLAFLPYSICQLTNLHILDARLNCLRSLPEGLENLISLQVLNVSQNFQYLDTLPYSIGLLLSLIELDISYNKIKVLPESMGCLKNLQKLCVAGNPLVSPPMEIVEQSLTAVKEYLSEKMNGNPNSPTKKASWLRKLKKYGTFNATMSNGPREEREGFIITDYHKIDAVTSPRHFNRLWPQRLLSYRNSFKK